MDKNQILTHMVAELDYFAKEYRNYSTDCSTDREMRYSISNDFMAYVRSYNALLNGMYRKISYVSFPLKIDKYIEQREQGIWNESKVS